MVPQFTKLRPTRLLHILHRLTLLLLTLHRLTKLQLILHLLMRLQLMKLHLTLPRLTKLHLTKHLPTEVVVAATSQVDIRWLRQCAAFKTISRGRILYIFFSKIDYLIEKFLLLKSANSIHFTVTKR